MPTLLEELSKIKAVLTGMFDEPGVLEQNPGVRRLPWIWHGLHCVSEPPADSPGSLFPLDSKSCGIFIRHLYFCCYLTNTLLSDLPH